VQNAMMMQKRNLDLWAITLANHQEKVANGQALKDRVHDTVWHYLRANLCSHLPEAQWDLVPCAPGTQIGKFEVGWRLGKGAAGAVYVVQDITLEHFDSANVMKVYTKDKIPNMQQLLNVGNELKVLQALSSDTGAHPNIIKLRDVFHSETEVLLLMENGGPRNLYKVLRFHDSKRIPMRLLKANQIIKQSISAVCHLHLVAQVVHRDIKPENVTVRDVPDGTQILLCDFEMARFVHDKAKRMRGYCGTFPFIAPEMARSELPEHASHYAPFPSDIWSMGILLLEVVCGCNVAITIAGGKPKGKQTLREKNALQAKIYDFFEQGNSDTVSYMLKKHLRPEFGNGVLQSLVMTVLEGMLKVDVASRWAAEDLSERALPGLEG
jgi:serine/threonine protein kinase